MVYFILDENPVIPTNPGLKEKQPPKKKLIQI